MDTRVLLVPGLDIDARFDRFEAAVLTEAGGLERFMDPADETTPVYSTVGDLHSRTAKLAEILGDAPYYLVGADRPALSMLGDYANSAHGLYPLEDASPRSVAIGCAVAAAGMKHGPRHLVVVGCREDVEELRQQLLLFLGSKSFQVIACGRLGLLEAEMELAAEAAARRAP